MSSSRRGRTAFFVSLLVVVLAATIPAGTRGAATEKPPAAPTAEPEPPAPGGGAAGVAAQEALARTFFSAGLDTTRGYAVSNLTLRKDAVTLLFRQGTLFLLEPIEGQITGAVFVGDGVVSYTPPNRTERVMLRKHAGTEDLAEPFNEAVLRFTDDSPTALLAGARPDPGAAARAAQAAALLAGRNGWLDGTRFIGSTMFAPEIGWLEARASSLPNLGVLIADVHTAKHDWLTYLHDPQRNPENILFESESMGAKGRRYLVIWSEWHALSEYGPKGHYQTNPDKDGPRLLRVVHNDMILDLQNTKVVDWEARLTVEARVDGLRALRFDLANNADFLSRWQDDQFYPVRLQSVTGEADRPLPFLHYKDQVVVFLDRPMTNASRTTLTFKGTAEVVLQLTAESFGLIQAAWYPQYGYLGGRSTFHWTVRVPKPYLVTGSGRAIRRFQDDTRRQNGLETGSDVPVTFPWVIFGRFQMAENRYEPGGSRPPVAMTIHSFPTMTSAIADPDLLRMLGASGPTTETLTAPLKKIEGFFAETREILKLYERIYARYPYDELHIAQMAPQLNFGQSPPGFVQLSGAVFMSNFRVESDFVHGFLAHEVAHQWWGNQVGWASPDDAWLSESFAEYASGIFINEYQGPKRFQQTLEEWKKLAKHSDAEAPIAAADTLLGSGPSAADHRTNLLYSKGPYVLHMLRVQMDDEKYVQVMKSIQETYRNRNISTEMLIREVNRVTQADYTYFFDQWFYDTGIPVFRYTWRSEAQPDGKFMVTVHVSQDDKKRVKKVLMPIHLHFKGKTIPQYRGVTEADVDLKFVIPEAPRDVTLDDDRTLLADIVRAG